METITEVRELAGKVHQLEEEVTTLRQQVRELRREKLPPSNANVGWTGQNELNNGQSPATSTLHIQWADQTALSQSFDKLFANLGIQDELVSIEKLQEMMGQAGLPKNALSRGIIEMRDE